MRNTKKAFTLVELIVVITILAILGTIAFISLQGYSGEARDSKRLSNVNDIVKKMNIEVSKGTALSSLVTGSGTNAKTINNTGATATQGVVNFLTLKESQTSFQDKINNVPVDYPVAYVQGGSGTGAYKFMQIATVNEAKNSAVVVGNYYKINVTTDSDGLIGAGSGVYDGGTTLPYSL
ncbi:MAG: type II secretion system protein [Candidatus Gracilibacteria bacterium]|nr:type II secretion system protein [Candidatus Gracilibacteria bacterium]